jgi:hypothetical protein
MSSKNEGDFIYVYLKVDIMSKRKTTFNLSKILNIDETKLSIRMNIVISWKYYALMLITLYECRNFQATQKNQGK